MLIYLLKNTSGKKNFCDFWIISVISSVESDLLILVSVKNSSSLSSNKILLLTTLLLFLLLLFLFIYDVNFVNFVKLPSFLIFPKILVDFDFDLSTSSSNNDCWSLFL